MDFHVTARAKCLGALMLALCSLTMEPATARAEVRSLKLRFLHTGETAEIVYKRNGRYDPAGLKKSTTSCATGAATSPPGWTRNC
jgi:uncharacterized protein YcbK (DUF882 family)